jgi:hypothetical protein
MNGLRYNGTDMGLVFIHIKKKPRWVIVFYNVVQFPTLCWENVNRTTFQLSEHDVGHRARENTFDWKHSRSLADRWIVYIAYDFNRHTCKPTWTVRLRLDRLCYVCMCIYDGKQAGYWVGTTVQQHSTLWCVNYKDNFFFKCSLYK